jgi:hypothetical protein
MLDELCAGNPRKRREAEQATREAIAARIEFWDGVLSALECERSAGNQRLAARAEPDACWISAFAGMTKIRSACSFSAIGNGFCISNHS